LIKAQIKFRSDWNTVKDVIEGREPLSTLSTVQINMKNIVKLLLAILGIIDALHLVLILCMPFMGLKILAQGVFYVIIYNSKELSSLSPETKFFLNITSSLLYFGSLIMALIIILVGKQNINRKLLFVFVLTLIPFLLILLKILVVPR